MTPSKTDLNSPPQEACPNWLDLPEDVLASILLRLGALEILVTAQLVCSKWRTVCNGPSIWRSISIRNCDKFILYDVGKLCRHAINRSAGLLQTISIEFVATDDLLCYIAYSSRHLKSLRLVNCHSISDRGLSDVAAKFPSLEDLDISYCSISKGVLEEVGRWCPLLRSFKFNTIGYIYPKIECDDQALAIAKTMPELHHLQIFGNKLTNNGLQAILDGCPHLESLDLGQCFNVNLEGHLGRRCADRIKDLHHPYEVIDNYPILFSKEDNTSGFSDLDLLSDYDEYYEFSRGTDFSNNDTYL